ncbi:putative PIN domain protein [Candidatus Termititenax persephonae]|uniref:PIN domain protein n=1 Tax=Candidatus Termititenax persephonae TaxID=2218525 RepID=A0A388TIJ9_9BACT|nr:putative PIN domain protein [Candidatus Termititenax persephonae]
MRYLVDSCVWIDFFNHKKHFKIITKLLFNNLAVVNEAILAEILPLANLRQERELVECLDGVDCLPLQIDWPEVENIQLRCLKMGMNKLGLLDIVIAQNAKQNNLTMFSVDKHLRCLCKLLGIKLYKQ